MRIFFASRNRHKIDEVRGVFGALPVELVSSEEFADVPEAVEDGATFEENAGKKAFLACRHLGLPVIAEDSGLEVEALRGEPGVRSARYAGEKSTQAALIEKLLANMEDVPDGRRAARFVTVAVFAAPCGFSRSDVWSKRRESEGCVFVRFRGECRGSIARAARGTNGFGYDPVFLLPGRGCTMAELSPEEKNRISHRSAAFRAMADFLKTHVL